MILNVIYNKGKDFEIENSNLKTYNGFQRKCFNKIFLILK
jgi:hypothetical protein